MKCCFLHPEAPELHYAFNCELGEGGIFRPSKSFTASELAGSWVDLVSRDAFCELLRAQRQLPTGWRRALGLEQEQSHDGDVPKDNWKEG